MVGSEPASTFVDDVRDGAARDGRRERVFKDYRPWIVVEELRSGTLNWEGRDLVVRRLDGNERSRGWHLYGIKEGGWLACGATSPRRL